MNVTDWPEVEGLTEEVRVVVVAIEASSLVMVPVRGDVPAAIVVLEDAPLIVKLKVSLASTVASPQMVMLTLVLLSTVADTSTLPVALM